MLDKIEVNIVLEEVFQDLGIRHSIYSSEAKSMLLLKTNIQKGGKMEKRYRRRSLLPPCQKYCDTH